MSRTHGCTCKQCVAACKTGKPGWFMPGEAEKAADFLRQPFHEFRDEHLVREYWIGGAMVYSPRRTFQPRGFPTAAYGDAFRGGRCVFLDEQDRCKIHPVKPFECREAMPCEKTTRNLCSEINRAWIAAGAPVGYEASYSADEEENNS